MNQAVQALAAYRRQFDQGYSRMPQAEVIPITTLAEKSGASAAPINWPGGDILVFPDGSRLIPPASGEYVRGRAPRWQTDEPETAALDERTADRRSQRR
jgi:hypothetical protein